MLEKPAIQDEVIIACLRDHYALNVAKLVFLPLGADANTAVYRAETRDSTAYFVKLRRGSFDDITVIVPKLLHDQGVTQIIPPLTTRSGALWAPLEGFAVMVSPFVEGYSGFEIDLLDRHWVKLGQVLRQMHAVTLPPDVLARLPRETYSPFWRERVRMFQEKMRAESFADDSAAALATFLNEHQNIVSELVARAERFAALLLKQPRDYVLCHADIHVGNVLIDRDSTLYVVDWDTLILAPKERDLMFPGAGIGSSGEQAEREAVLFRDGYGDTTIDAAALVYYRYERIVQDIAEYCQQLLLTDEGGADRAEGLRQLQSQFLPGQVIDIAFRTERQLLPELHTGLPPV